MVVTAALALFVIMKVLRCGSRKHNDGIIQLRARTFDRARRRAQKTTKKFCATLAPSMDLPRYAFIVGEIMDVAYLYFEKEPGKRRGANKELYVQ